MRESSRLHGRDDLSSVAAEAFGDDLADDLRVLVKRILRKYGYPPDKQDHAVQTVLQQAETLSAEWATS